jgi:signal transduction histidine kinase/CheY-like chemotaxis protein
MKILNMSASDTNQPDRPQGLVQRLLFGDWCNPDDLDQRRKSLLLHTLSIVAVLVITVVGFIFPDYPNNLAMIADIVAFAILGLNLVLLRWTKNLQLAMIVATSTAGILLFLVFATASGTQSAMFLWTYIYPLAAFFLVGYWWGLVFVTIYSVAIFATIFIKGDSLTIVAVDPLFLKRYAGSYLAVSILAMFFERARYITQIKLTGEIQVRRQTEIELVNAKEVAEEASRFKSDFLAKMSHEIRTPLNGIIGVSHLLLEHDVTPAYKQHAEVIATSADSLLNIVNQILDLSKVEAGRMSLDLKPFDLSSLITNLAELHRPRAEAKGLDLQTGLPTDLSRLVIGDSMRIRQVLENLVGNSVKFTPAGSVKIDVAIENLSDKTVVLRFTVTDTGIGIPADQQQAIFGEFIQADQATSRFFGGTGLGLAITQQLLELMDSKLILTSQVGQGSTFEFHLELGLADSLERPEKEPAPNSDFSQVRVLIAEDNEINLKITMHMLAKHGFIAESAADGLQAVKLWTQHKYDLIIMDCQMPNMDGIEATRTIRKQESADRHVPIIALTANAREADRQSCLDAGMDDFLSKPIDQDSFIRIAQKYLKFGA